MGLFVFSVIVGLFIWCDRRIVRRARRENDGLRLHHDMYDKYMELCDDPTMSEIKWAKWIPVFEAADKMVVNLAPEMGPVLGKVSSFAKKRIDDESLLQ